MSDGSLRRNVFPVSLAVLALGSVLWLVFSIGLPKGHGQAPASPQCKEIHLEPGQKLESVSWACAPGGYCVPTWLTRPMRPGEKPETHTLHNEQGAYDSYIFDERIIQR